MVKPRDKNIEKIHHRGGKGPHYNKRKDKKYLRKKIKETLRHLIQPKDGDF